ncbi:hypothetical protein Tco_0412967 [Tanacetum coccineum]
MKMESTRDMIFTLGYTHNKKPLGSLTKTCQIGNLCDPKADLTDEISFYDWKNWIGTDKSKMTRKQSKASKHGHENQKSTKPKPEKPKTLAHFQQGPVRAKSPYNDLSAEEKERASSNARNQAMVQDGKVVVQDVRGRYNANTQGRPFQRNNTRGNGVAGNVGGQNRGAMINP